MPNKEVNRFVYRLFGLFLVLVAFNGGRVCVEAAQFQLEEQVGSPGRPVAATVRVADFSSVQALQFSLHWDPSVLNFQSVTAFGLPGLGVSSFGVFDTQGQLSVIWDASTLVGESLEDGSVLFTLHFEVLGEDGATSEIQFADQPTEPLVVVDLARGEFLSTDGRVTVGLPPEIVAPTSVTIPEDHISDPLPITVTDDGPEAIGLTARSTDESLIAPEGIRLTGEGAQRELVLEPVADRSGLVEILLEASDATGGRSETRIEVTIVAVNDPPRAVDDALEILEDSEAVLVSVLENDTSAPDQNEVLRVTEINPGSGTGLAELEGDAIRYRPAPNFFGVDEVGYQIDDGRGASASAVLRITVMPVNDPPVARDDRIEVDEDIGFMDLDLLANDDIEPDENEVLQVTSVSETSAGGLALLEEGRIRYRPAGDFFGEERFQYTVSDGGGESAEAQVIVVVSPKNDLPVAVDDGVSVPEDSVDVLIDVLENDHSGPDPGETLVVEAIGDVSSGGLVALSPDGILYTPAPNFFGVETFEYTINDGNGGLATGRVTVTVVNDQSDAPVARDDRFALAEDSQEQRLAVLEDNGNGRDFDPDGDAIRIIEAVADGEGTVAIDATGTALVYSPAADFVGAETLSYRISDGANVVTGLVFVTVADANNDPPVAQPDVFEVLEDSSANRLAVLNDNGAGVDRDPEEGALTVSLVPGASGPLGELVLTEDQTAFLYTPVANFSGSERFDYILSDGLNESRGEVEVTVVNVDNDPPVARPDIIEVQEDIPNQPLELLLDNGAGADFDPELETLEIASLDLPDELDVGELLIGEGRERVFYSPIANFTGEFEFRYQISDGEQFAAAPATVTVRVVNGDNDPPVALDDEFSVDEGAVGAVLPVLGNSVSGFDFDPEGQPLSVVKAAVEGDLGGEVSVGANGSVLLYTPGLNFSGEEILFYDVSDGFHVATGRVVVRVVNNDDDPPIARDDLVRVVEDSLDHPIFVLGDNGNGPDFDPEGSVLEIVGLERLGEFQGELLIGDTGRTVRYSPVQNFVGEESFRYIISDGTHESVATVEIVVTNGDNDPPITQRDLFLVFDDVSESTFRVLEDNGNGPDIDLDGDELTIVRVAESTDEAGSVHIVDEGKAIVYSSASGFSGTDRFVYVVSDGVHEAAGEVVVIVTGADNESPIAQADQFSIVEDSAEIVLALLDDNGNGPDEDPNGEPVSIVAVHGPASGGGRVARSQNGREVVYSPAENFVGQETFGYTISDGALTASGLVTIDVTPVPDPPVIDSIDDVVVEQGETAGFFEFRVTDVDTALESLIVSITIDRPDLLPTERLQLSQIGERWRADFELVPGRSGVVEVTVEASDRESTREETFRLLIRETVNLTGGIPNGLRQAGRVFIDSNDNRTRDGLEPETRFDLQGEFTLQVTLEDHDRNGDRVLNFQDGVVVVEGAYDPWTGLRERGVLVSPLGFRVVSPQTTLIAALLNAEENLSVSGAIERAAALLGIEDLDSLQAELLPGNPVAPVDEIGFQRQNQLQNVMLDGVVQQVCQLLGSASGSNVSECTRAVYAVLAQTGGPLFQNRASIEDLIIRVGGELDAPLSIDVIEFASSVIWAQRERLLVAASDEEGALFQILAPHRLFAGVEIESLMRELGGTDTVSDVRRFEYLESGVLERLSVYPSHDVIASLGHEGGGMRFLYRSASIDEKGRSINEPIVVRDGPHSGALEGVLVAVGDSASTPSDILVQPLPVSLEEGQRFARLDLSPFVVDDNEVEGEEQAVIRLFFGEEVDENEQAIVRDFLTWRILDDEFSGQFGFAEALFELEEDAVTPAVFIQRTGGHAGAIDLQIRLSSADSDAAATDGEDYISTPIGVSFEPGQMWRRVIVPLVPDFRVEPDETIQLELYRGMEGESGLVSGAHPAVDVRIVNDDFDQAPTIEAPSAVSTDEDSPVRIAFSIADDQTPIVDLTVEAVTETGTLLTVDGVDFDPDTSMHSVLVTPHPNVVGEGFVGIRVTDGRQAVAKTIVVNVLPTNDPPIVELDQLGPFRFVEGQAPVILVREPVVSDLDGGMLTGATLSLVEGFRAGEDRLFFSGVSTDIDAVYDEDAGILRLLGTASPATYQDALQHVFYDNRSQSPSTAERVVRLTVRDEDEASLPVEIRVTVESVNDRPILGRIESNSLIYLENAPPTAVTTGITIELGDDEVLHGATVRIVENYQAAEDRLLVDPIPEGLSVQSFDVDRGEIEIAGVASIEAYQSVLRSVRFLNLSEHPQTVIRRVEFAVFDVSLESNPVSRLLQTVPVNDPPVLAPIPDLEVRLGSLVRVPLEISDIDSPFRVPSVSIESDPLELIVASSVQVHREAERHELSFEVRNGLSGSARLMVAVSDGADITRQQFQVNVVPVLGAEVLLGPSELVVLEDVDTEFFFDIVPSAEPTEISQLRVEIDDSQLANGEVTAVPEIENRIRLLIRPETDRSGASEGRVLLSINGSELEHRFELIVRPVNDLPQVVGVEDVAVKPGSTVRMPLTVVDAETPTNRLILGARLKEPDHTGQVRFQIDEQGARQVLEITLAGDASGRFSAEFVVVDGEGGVSVFPFEIFGEIFRPESIGIRSLGQGRIEVSWEGAGRLAQSESIDGPFVPIAEASNPYVIGIERGFRFFRLLEP